jgi:hypothetical protein
MQTLIFKATEKDNIIPLDCREYKGSKVSLPEMVIDFELPEGISSFSLVEGESIEMELLNTPTKDDYWFGNYSEPLSQLPLYGIVTHPIMGKIIVTIHLSDSDSDSIYWTEADIQETRGVDERIVDNHRLIAFMEKHSLKRDSLYYSKWNIMKLYPETEGLLSWWYNSVSNDDVGLHKTALTKIKGKKIKYTGITGVSVEKIPVAIDWEWYLFVLRFTTSDGLTWTFIR